MHKPRVRLAAGRIVTAAAIVVGSLATDWLIVDLHLTAPVYVAVSACVASVFALGAMRNPWYFLAIAVLLTVAVPSVSDSSAHDLFVRSYQGGWFLGALAGWIFRRTTRFGGPNPRRPAPRSRAGVA